MSDTDDFSDEDVFNDETGDDAVHQSGGKMIGDGVYGCVFMPKLKCKPNTTVTLKGTSVAPSESYVSKLIDPESASIEFRLSKTISNIPLWKNYFVISESMCTPAVQQTESDLGKCEVLEDVPITSFKMLSMPYRGDSLHLHRFPSSSFDFMRFAKHLMEAGALMALFQIVHRDLHQGNILVDSQHVPRIIDFNLSFHVQQKVTAGALAHSFDPLIAHESPDSCLINAIDRHTMYRNHPDRAIRAIIDQKNILKRIRSLFGGSSDGAYMELEEFYRLSKSAKTGDTASWFRMYWSKIDSWAIGVIIVDMIIQFMSMRDFTVQYSKIKPLLLPILKDMCQLNPVKRIDCVQALQRLDPNHFIIRKYATEWLSAVRV
jgi:serine/threonine protein kinase